MLREMRRRAQQLDASECDDILRRNNAGVLAVSGDDGFPYAVPISYIYSDGKIYFHSAVTGHKIESISRSERVSFCVMDKNEVVPGEYTTYYRSVIAFGRARIITDDAEKLGAIEALGRHFYPGDSDENRSRVIERSLASLVMVEIDIEHMTGKQAKELANRAKI